MVSMIDSRALGLGVMVGVLAGGCTGPNPLLDAGQETGETVAGDGDGDPTGDGDGDPSGDGDGDPTGDGDGDGDPTGDGDGEDPCQNGVQDGDETDEDCGGSCGPCMPGDSCEMPADCDSMVCDASVCAEPSCTDEVLNGDELETDCGGSCTFCAHSEFIAEIDDFPTNDVLGPNVAAFDNGDWVVMYAALQTAEHRLVWFEPDATPLGPPVSLTTEVDIGVFAWQSIVAGNDVATHDAYGVVNGDDVNSVNHDVFAIERGPQTAESNVPIYQGPTDVTWADMTLADDDVATFVWLENDRVMVRRYNYANAQDVGPTVTANPDMARVAKRPTLAQHGSVSYVTWISCDAIMTSNCDVEVRRFDDGWIDDAGPVALGLQPALYFDPQIAVAEDGRVGLTWRLTDGNTKQMWAAMLDADLVIIDSEWVLQNNYVSTFTAASDVAALADGTFVYAWPNGGAQTVHVRRFVAPNVPLVPDVIDESTWPAIADPSWVRLATAQNFVMVVWSGHMNDYYQAQGQVLSY
jgi:hypothetical protein